MINKDNKINLSAKSVRSLSALAETMISDLAMSLPFSLFEPEIVSQHIRLIKYFTTLKIQLVILPEDSYTFPCKFNQRTWCHIKIT